MSTSWATQDFHGWVLTEGWPYSTGHRHKQDKNVMIYNNRSIIRKVYFPEQNPLKTEFEMGIYRQEISGGCSMEHQ